MTREGDGKVPGCVFDASVHGFKCVSAASSLYQDRKRWVDKLRLKSMVSVSVDFAVVLVQSLLTSVTVTLSRRKKYCVMSNSFPNTFAPQPYLVYVRYCLFILCFSVF